MPKRYSLLIIISLLSTAISIQAFAQDDFNVSFVGHWPFGIARVVTIHDNYAYVGAGGGIYILNIQNLSNIIPVSEIRTRGLVEDFYISGDFLYVAGGESGLEIINISNPSLPFITGSYDTPDHAREVEVTGNYAFIADNRAGIQVAQEARPLHGDSHRYSNHYKRSRGSRADQIRGRA